MEVFRISSAKYAKTLSTSGAANRWNKFGQHVIYCSSSRSLASIELVVHRASIQPLGKYKVMVLHLPDSPKHYEEFQIKQLPKNWRSLGAYADLQKLGSKWYEEKKSLILKIPSVVVPQEYNYIINTSHKDFKPKIKLVTTEPYFWDTRLF